MRRFSKVFSALGLGAATLSLAACGGHGPNSYLMAKDPIKAKLTGAEKTFKSPANIPFTVKATSWQGDKLNVSITGPSGSPTRCQAVVEAIDEEWTRVSPDCAKEDGKTERMISEMQVDEFVIAVLYDEPMNNTKIANRTSAIVIETMGDIQKRVAADLEEASKASEASYSSADFGEYSDSDWGN